ncbi:MULTISPECIES: hypothetical protein [Rhizobium]|uniref:hypothetical protein n=1 Tax=Rhizobium TaxID=379 RepID=UPI001FAB7D60|nr:MULTISPECIES: hypothetical protein [Rhizobium]
MPNYRVPKYHTWRSDAPVWSTISTALTALDAGDERRRDSVMEGFNGDFVDRTKIVSAADLETGLSELVFHALRAMCRPEPRRSAPVSSQLEKAASGLAAHL